MKTPHWLTLFALGLSACGATPIAPPKDLGDCERACEVLETLGCPEAKPTARGASCVSVCEANREMLSVSCVSRAGTIDEMRACNVRCK